MKIVFSKLMSLFLFVVCMSGAAHAFEEPSFTQDGLQKYYVQPSDVKVANNGIVVLVEGNMLEVSSLYTDEVGVYIAGLGRCRYCGKANDNWGRCEDPKCQNFGKR